MRRALKVLIVFISFYSSSYSQARYQFVYSQGPNMHFGAENIISAHHLWRQVDNQLIPSRIFRKKTFLSEAGNVIYRMTKLFISDYPLAFVLPSLQHERYGHGVRVKEFGGLILSVDTPLPPPFKLKFPGIGFNYSHPLTKQQRMVVAGAGSEANAVMASLLRKNMLLDGKLDYHDAFLYLYSNNDLSGYALFAAGISGSDIQTYLTDLYSKYPSNVPSLKRIKGYSLISVLTDPLNYHSIDRLFRGYIWKGQNSAKIEFIRFGEQLSYLPKFEFYLGPLGPELRLQNYFKYKKTLFAGSLGLSDGTVDGFWRLRTELWNLKVKDKLFIQFCSELWQQPSIEYFVDDQIEVSAGVGGLFWAAANLDLFSKIQSLGLVLQLGYKSRGFSVGEMLDKGLILRTGLSFRFEEAKP